MRWALHHRSTALFAALLFSCPAFTEPLTDPEDMELIRTLLAHNRAELEKIKSFWFEYEWESVDETEGFAPAGIPAGTCVMRGKVVYIREGHQYRYDCTFRRKVLGTDYIEEDQTQSILTDKCFVVIPSRKLESIRYVDISLNKEMLEQDRHLSETIIAPDILNYGFDNGVYGVSHRIRPESTNTKWSVDQGSDGRIFTILAHSMARSIVTEYTVAADQGYLISRKHVKDKEGNTLTRINCVPMQVSKVWVPKYVENFDPLNNSSFSLKVTKAEVNEPIAKETFDFETLKFDRTKVRLQKIVSGHEPVYLVFKAGEWIPEQVADAIPE